MIASTIAVVLFAAFMLLILGVDVEYESGKLSVTVKAGPAKTRVFPAAKKPEAEPEAEKPEKGAKPEKRKERLRLPDRAILLDAAAAAAHALGRFGRSFSIDVLTINFTAGAEDPLDAVTQYGYASAAIGAVLPFVKNSVKIREHEIWTNLDFDLRSPVIYIRFAASLAVWQLLYIVMAFGTELLNSIYRNR